MHPAESTVDGITVSEEDCHMTNLQDKSLEGKFDNNKTEFEILTMNVSLHF